MLERRFSELALMKKVTADRKKSVDLTDSFVANKWENSDDDLFVTHSEDSQLQECGDAASVAMSIPQTTVFNKNYATPKKFLDKL